MFASFCAGVGNSCGPSSRRLVLERLFLVPHLWRMSHSTLANTCEVFSDHDAQDLDYYADNEDCSDDDYADYEADKVLEFRSHFFKAARISDTVSYTS